MRAQGFTLIELLITVAIVGILAVLATPNMADYIVQERVRGVLINLKQELAFARSEAIKRNVTIYVSATEGANWCVGLSTAPACNCALSDPDQASACVLPVNGVRVLRRLQSADYPSVTMDAKADVNFDGVRGTASKADTFSFSSDAYAGNVIISKLGRVRTCGNPSGMESCPQ